MVGGSWIDDHEAKDNEDDPAEAQDSLVVQLKSPDYESYPNKGQGHNRPLVKRSSKSVLVNKKAG